jgi:sulfoxide reductase heme-binding subunit YedZ
VAIADRINGTARRVPPWTLYAAAVLPPSWLLYAALTGGLGVEPIEAMEHQLGEWGLQVLIAGLAVTPLRRWGGVNLLKFRRALGLIAFTYIGLHLTVWAVLDVQDPARIWADIVKRPYITIGMLAFLLMVPLAATSNNRSVRKLGRRWNGLHKLTYPAVALGAVHWVMLAKGFQVEPLVYLAAVLALIGLRYVPSHKGRVARSS